MKGETMKGENKAKYVCTSGQHTIYIARKLRARVISVISLGLLAIICSPSALAQNFRTRTDQAQATLHITALIVPSVMAVPPRANNETRSSITYNVPSMQMPLTSTQQTRPLAASAVLKTVTVVAQ
jgi:hypothetical protein